MKKKWIIMIIAAVVIAAILIIILSKIDTDITKITATESSLNGNWIDGADEFRFDNENWESWNEGTFGIRGKKTTENDSITLTITEVYNGFEWESYPEESQAGTFFINGNTLELTFNSETRTFIKK